MSDLVCKECGKPRSVGRRLCRDCNLMRLRKTAKLHFEQYGRTQFALKCAACSADFMGWKKTQLLCRECYTKTRFHAASSDHNPYVYSGVKDYRISVLAHRVVASNVLGRKLKTHEVVHHLDEDQTNNNRSNLVVISRSAHGKLHRFISDARVIFKNLNPGDSGAGWKAFVGPLALAWLCSCGLKFVRLH